jgi:hypothetical protein
MHPMHCVRLAGIESSAIPQTAGTAVPATALSLRAAWAEPVDARQNGRVISVEGHATHVLVTAVAVE